MTKQNKGMLYEKKTYNCLRDNVPSSVRVLKQAGGHGRDACVEHSICPNDVGFEMKRNVGDTMGGTSLRYSNNNLLDTPVRRVDGFYMIFPVIQARIIEPIREYLCRANELIVIRNMHSPDKYEPITEFPARIPVNVRERLMLEGFQNKIQSMYPYDIENWKAFYRDKGNSYIQIGGKGLFHLGENPLNLPVPEINGSICLEVRLYPRGAEGKPYVRVEIALKFKGLICNTSPYSLDNKNDVVKIFKHLEAP